MRPLQDVCSDCARRSWTVARLAGHLEQCRGSGDVVREVLALDDRSLISALGGREMGAILSEWAAVRPTDLLADWSRAGTSAICRHAGTYPGGLLDLADLPAVLHLHGDPGRLRGLVGPQARTVAIVGARRASVEGRETAAALARGLSAAGVTVVSGMALGVDSAAHEGALRGDWRQRPPDA